MNIRDENEEYNIDLTLLFQELVKYIWLIAVVVLLFGIAGYSYTKLCKPLEYTTSTCLYVKSNDQTSVISNASLQELDASKSLAETYIVILSNDAIMDVVAEKLTGICTPEEIETYFAVTVNENGETIIDPKSILPYVSFGTVNETEIIQISATTPSPTISAEICRIIADTAPSVINRVVGTGFVETINEAKVPLLPSGPNAIKNGIMLAAIGFILICGIIILRYMLNRTINNGEEFRNKCSLPVLSEIPTYHMDEQKQKSSVLSKYIPSLRRKDAQARITTGTILTDKVQFSVTESYNMLRTNLNFTLSTHENNAFVISSPLSGDGKSTTAANIAITIAQTKAKVLLVDCDLRRPNQHKMFNLKNEKGLSSVLTGEKFDSVVNRNVYENLDVLTSGSMPPNPSELLGSNNMNRFLEKVKETYDYVILDTSPINVVTDALLLSKTSAGIMLVVRQGISTYDEIERTIESINFVEGNILGVVINSVDEGNTKYGKYGKYGRKYGYAYKANPYDTSQTGKDEKK